MRGWRRDDEPEDDLVRERFTRVLRLPPDPDDPDEPAGSTGAVRPPVERDTAGAGRPPDSARRALAELDPGRRGVRALALVAAVVICVAAFFAWQARPRAVPAPTIAEASAPSSEPSMVVVVSVGGRVQRPGLVRLPAGSRVADAIEAAGGPLPGTDLSYVNLARKLVDGELIIIGATAPPGVASSGTGAGKVNLNTASLSELQTLPGVGEVIAQRIIEYRESHGQFRSVNELRQVDGIGDAKFQQLKDRVTV